MPLSDSDLERYLTLIGLPSEYRQNGTLDYDFLKALFIRHIGTFPYENLSLHYSKDGRISLDLPSLTEKYLSGRGRGGYCMEGSLLFNHVLRTIGFDAYTTGVRIRYRVDGIPQGDYSGWVHVVNIVNLADGSCYVCDVAFGGDGPTVPLPLVTNQISHNNIGTQEVRYIHEPISQFVRRKTPEMFWIYQYRNSPTKEWNSFYCFDSDIVFLRRDFEVMNFYTSSSPESFQTYTALIVRFLIRESSSGVMEVYGKRMLVNGEVKENVGNGTVVVKTCRTEGERVTALKEYFGIELTDEEKVGIKGRVTELGQNY